MKLAIGTVQFGLDYGVSNTAGKTSREEVERILGRARAAGIDTLDTAAAYGDSERVLGRIGVEGWRVITKVPPLPENAEDTKELVLHHLRKSLSQLGVQRLDGLLLHNSADLLKAQGANIVAALREAKANGLVGKVGYSIYSPQSLPELLRVMLPDIVQAPFNIVDQRLANSGWLDRLVDNGIEVHTRSVFLQGLLLMESGRRPGYFGRWNSLWQRWDALVGEHGGSALRVCLNYVKSQPRISRVVVGVESLHQLEQLLAAWQDSAPLDGGLLSCDDPMLVEPSNWMIHDN